MVETEERGIDNDDSGARRGGRTRGKGLPRLDEKGERDSEDVEDMATYLEELFLGLKARDKVELHADPLKVHKAARVKGLELPVLRLSFSSFDFGGKSDAHQVWSSRALLSGPLEDLLALPLRHLDKDLFSLTRFDAASMELLLALCSSHCAQ